MYGCVSDAVYSARHTLSSLKKNPLFQYHSGVRVDRLSQNKNSIQIDAYDIHHKTPVSFSASQLFLAAGVIMSSYILLKSFSWLSDAELLLDDSQHFLLPGIMFRRIKNVRHSPSHALCHLLYEVVHPEILAESIHMQLYTYTSLYENEFENKFKFLKKFKKVLFPFYERLVVIQGFLPSQISGRISMRYRAGDERLIITGHKNKGSAAFVKRISMLFAKQSAQLGFFPLVPACQISQIGSSNHYGGSFPMRKKPVKANETDCFGSPPGLDRIHLVDASVLPSIQAQSVTLTSMANAYRIGHTCAIK